MYSLNFLRENQSPLGLGISYFVPLLRAATSSLYFVPLLCYETINKFGISHSSSSSPKDRCSSLTSVFTCFKRLPWRSKFLHTRSCV